MQLPISRILSRKASYHGLLLRPGVAHISKSAENGYHWRKMTTTPERRKIARDEIARALESRRHAFAIHYAGANFAAAERRVVAIVARNLGTGVTYCFELESELRRLGHNPTQSTIDELNLAERKMFDAFYSFVREHKHHYWLHWNMRNSLFGFLGMENRQRALGGKIVEIPEEYRIDLADRLIDLYGDRYAPAVNRLRGLAKRNGIPLPHLMDGIDQGRSVERHDYSAVTRSLLNRIDVMYIVAIKAKEGTLRTDAPWKDRVAGAGGLLKWAKEHPIILVCAIIAPVISLVLFGVRVWEWLQGTP